MQPPLPMPPASLVLAALLFWGSSAQAAEWRQFRGPNGSGIAETGDLPVKFGPGDKVVWKTSVPPGQSSSILTSSRIFLTASEDEVSIETAAIHIPSQREIVWRVRPRSEGVHRMIVHVGDFEIEKSLVAGSVPGLLSSGRTGRGALDLLLHPGERLIEASAPLAAIEVVYPEAEFSVLGIRTHWVYPFLLLSMASGYLAKGMLGVEI